MTINIKLDPGAFPPDRAHPTDAGLDLKAKESVAIPGRQSKSIDTGVHVELPAGYYGKIESKSGLNVKHSVVCCGGVVDEGYTGSIVVKLYNLSLEDYIVFPGDKIAQLVIMPYIAPDIAFVDELSETDRGANGFGSTGR